MLISGIIIGFLIAIIVLLCVKRYQVPIERTIKQAENKVKQEGAIFIEDEGVEDLKAWLNKLPNE